MLADTSCYPPASRNISAASCSVEWNLCWAQSGRSFCVAVFNAAWRGVSDLGMLTGIFVHLDKALERSGTCFASESPSELRDRCMLVLLLRLATPNRRHQILSLSWQSNAAKTPTRHTALTHSQSGLIQTASNATDTQTADVRSIEDADHKSNKANADTLMPES
jgi:hypothetical protein